MGVLSTISEDGKPWGSAIYFVADDDFTCYFVTRADTHKYKNLTNRPAAALTVADEEHQTTVQIYGSVSTVPTYELMDVAFHKLEKIRPKGDINWVPPIYKVHKGDFMVMQLVPEKLQYADYSKPINDIHQDYIEQII